MSTPGKPTRSHQEQPNTYFVQDRSNQELLRLRVQDQMLTAGMGGVLPEQPDPTIFEHVLDIGCGTGSWLIEAAKTYPTMSHLVGIDISSKMVKYAREQVKAQQVSGRVEIHTMDMLCPLEFPDHSFDLVNLRLGVSYLRTWDWLKILQEFQRITRSGGVIRLTECDVLIETTSPAYTYINQLLVQSFSRAGHLFNQKSDGVIQELAPLLNRYGLRSVQTRVHKLKHHAGTIEGQYFAEDMRLLFKALVPFFRKWTQVPDDYDAIYQRMLDEMQQPDFVATWTLLTAWGTTH
jgi:ubiquinone/menaquinone biosynthesis C-methylase UbiE